LIFNRVVQQCGDGNVRFGTVSSSRNEVGNVKEMIDVWFGGLALTPLMNMPLGGKIGGPKNQDKPLHSFLSPKPIVRRVRTLVMWLGSKTDQN
jgi:hypothetical protein